MAGTLTLSRVLMMLTLMLIDFNVNQATKANAQTSKERKVLRGGFFWIFNAKVQPDLKDTKQGLASGNGTFLADQ